MSTHDHLCERAAAWLRSTGRCDPVLAGIASCYEIPDAIGWNVGGSIVIECKTSRVDFLRDRKKYVRLRHPDGWAYQSKRLTKKKAVEMGCVEEPIANMGDRRYFLCPPEVATAGDGFGAGAFPAPCTISKIVNSPVSIGSSVGRSRGIFASAASRGRVTITRFTWDPMTCRS